jgi:integrase/recombinase XerD
VKTLSNTGACVGKLTRGRVGDVDFDLELPQIGLTYAKKNRDRYVPILPGLAQEWRTHLAGRTFGLVFERNRPGRDAIRTLQSLVQRGAKNAGLEKHVHLRLIRDAVAVRGMPIDGMQKFWGYSNVSTTRIHAETSLGGMSRRFLVVLSR